MEFFPELSLHLPDYSFILVYILVTKINTMSKRIVLYAVMMISIVIFFSCSKSPEKKIVGIWKVEDVKFENAGQMDPAQLEASKESAKSVSYELLEDKTAKIHVGSTVLEGNWTYREAEAGVYMAFTGSFDTVLLGRMENGRLINEANRPNIKITTIFIKE